MTKAEAYYRLTQVMEQVNAVVALLFSSDVMKETEEKRQEKIKRKLVSRSYLIGVL